MIKRKLNLPPPSEETFFLWGPRQTGKSTFLRTAYPDAVWIDLLKAEEFRRYLNYPEILRQELPRVLRCTTSDMIRCKFRGMASLGIWAKLTVPFQALPPVSSGTEHSCMVTTW